jgi:2,3-bisphosphoglycerate-independent phosphoglycerate mutase
MISIGKRKRNCCHAANAIQGSYEANITDEFINPTVINTHNEPIAVIEVIYFNFRTDRGRELTR